MRFHGRAQGRRKFVAPDGRPPHTPRLILIPLNPCFYVPEMSNLQLSAADALRVVAVEARTSFSIAEVDVFEAVHAWPYVDVGEGGLDLVGGVPGVF